MRNMKELALLIQREAATASSDLTMAYRCGGVAGVGTLILMAPTMTAFAAETPALFEEAGGTNLLPPEVLASITQGFASIVITATAVVSMAVLAGVSIIGITSAAKYAMKKFRGVLSSAG